MLAFFLSPGRAANAVCTSGMRAQQQILDHPAGDMTDLIGRTQRKTLSINCRTGSFAGSSKQVLRWLLVCVHRSSITRHIFGLIARVPLQLTSGTPLTSRTD